MGHRGGGGVRWGRGFPPAAVGIAAQQNLSAATADGAVGLVAVIVVHVGHFQIDILRHSYMQKMYN